MKTALIVAGALATANAGWAQIDPDLTEIYGAVGDDLYTAFTYEGSGDLKIGTKYPTYNQENNVIQRAMVYVDGVYKF